MMIYGPHWIYTMGNERIWSDGQSLDTGYKLACIILWFWPIPTGLLALILG